MSRLDQILEHKRLEVAAAKERVTPADLAEAARSRQSPVRGLRSALASAKGVAVIAEFKRRSPSRGAIRAEADPSAVAEAYAQAGAAALSVLTDARYFGGSLDDLRAARAATALPTLRKDFVVDAYQIDEACAAGADAVLLIVAALAPDVLARLHGHAKCRGLDALVEVHGEEEVEMALAAGADLVGINNRDLHSFETDLSVTERLAPGIPSSVLVVAESGIGSPEDIERLTKAGARAFLVGESLMREQDPGRALRQLRGTK